MIQKIMDDNGKTWFTEGEIRYAGPYEHYIHPYPKEISGKYPKVESTGEHKTLTKVLVVYPADMKTKQKFSNN